MVYVYVHVDVCTCHVPREAEVETGCPFPLLFNINFLSYILYKQMFWLHVCLCACNIHEGQKNASNSLELELQMVLSHYVGAEI